MTPEEKAENIVNELFDRSLSHNDACIAGKFLVERILFELELIRKPEYTSFIVNAERNEVMDGYERIEYWEKVQEHIGTL